VFFPKWGLATGKAQIGQLFADFSALLKGILHDYASFNWIMTGTDTFACEGIYLDPDYAGSDTARYPWLAAGGRDPSMPMGS
jgi:hypothetical protein